MQGSYYVLGKLEFGLLESPVRRVAEACKIPYDRLAQELRKARMNPEADFSSSGKLDLLLLRQLTGREQPELIRVILEEKKRQEGIFRGPGGGWADADEDEWPTREATFDAAINAVVGRYARPGLILNYLALNRQRGGIKEGHLLAGSPVPGLFGLPYDVFKVSAEKVFRDLSDLARDANIGDV